MKCPCHSKRPYKECCEPYHKGQLPETPLQLMRSRYSAYAMGDADYIMATTHPKSPHFQKDKEAWKKTLLEFTADMTFEGLEILDSDASTVTFVAHLRQGVRDASFKERSRFEKVDGKWLYLEGIIWSAT